MSYWQIIHDSTPQSPAEGAPKPAPRDRTVTDVMKVAGGSVMRTRCFGQGVSSHAPASVAMVFLPDPDNG